MPYALPLSFALAILCSAACRRAALPAGSVPVDTLTGFFSVVVGDPMPPAQTPSYMHFLATPGGRTVSIVPDSAYEASLGDIRRFHGAMVRAVGRYASSDSTVLRVRSLDSIRQQPTR